MERESAELIAANNEEHNVLPFTKTGFDVYLQKFMGEPLDQDAERRFAAELLTMSFLAPIQIARTESTPKKPQTSLQLALAVTTYLADGHQYVPVFSQASKFDNFMNTTLRQMEFRSLEFSGDELMSEVGRMDVAGLLINPGYQNFPLSIEYWNYIHQVVPLVLDQTDEDFRMRMMSPVPPQLAHNLSRVLKHQAGAERAWLIDLKLRDSTRFETGVIVDWRGNSKDFGNKLARRLAVAAHRYVKYGANFLVGTTDDPVGQLVEKNLEPFYQRHHLRGD